MYCLTFNQPIFSQYSIGKSFVKKELRRSWKRKSAIMSTTFCYIFCDSLFLLTVAPFGVIMISSRASSNSFSNSTIIFFVILTETNITNERPFCFKTQLIINSLLKCMHIYPAQLMDASRVHRWRNVCATPRKCKALDACVTSCAFARTLAYCRMHIFNVGDFKRKSLSTRFSMSNDTAPIAFNNPGSISIFIVIATHCYIYAVCWERHRKYRSAVKRFDFVVDYSESRQWNHQLIDQIDSKTKMK